MPENYLHLGLIATLFPKTVLIRRRRDLRDVAVSCWMTDFIDVPWANDPEHIASCEQYVRLMDHCGATLPLPILEVDYEEAVAGRELVVRYNSGTLAEWNGAAVGVSSHATADPHRQQ